MVSSKTIQGPGRQLIIDGSFDTTNNRLIIAGYHLGNITFAPTIPLLPKWTPNIHVSNQDCAKITLAIFNIII